MHVILYPCDWRPQEMFQDNKLPLFDFVKPISLGLGLGVTHAQFFLGNDVVGYFGGLHGVLCLVCFVCFHSVNSIG